MGAGRRLFGGRREYDFRGVDFRLGGSRNERHFGLSDAGKNGLEERERMTGFFEDPLVFGDALLVGGTARFSELSGDDFCGVLGLGWALGIENRGGGVDGEKKSRTGSVYELVLDTARVCELGVDAERLLNHVKRDSLLPGCTRGRRDEKLSPLNT